MKPKIMISKGKDKIEIVLEKGTIQKLKERSTREGKPLSDIIEAAILKYTYGDIVNRKLRIAAAVRFCSKPFKLKASEINSILNL